MSRKSLDSRYWEDVTDVLGGGESKASPDREYRVFRPTEGVATQILYSGDGKPILALQLAIAKVDEKKTTSGNATSKPTGKNEIGAVIYTRTDAHPDATLHRTQALVNAENVGFSFVLTNFCHSHQLYAPIFRTDADGQKMGTLVNEINVVEPWSTLVVSSDYGVNNRRLILDTIKSGPSAGFTVKQDEQDAKAKAKSTDGLYFFVSVRPPTKADAAMQDLFVNTTWKTDVEELAIAIPLGTIMTAANALAALPQPSNCAQPMFFSRAGAFTPAAGSAFNPAGLDPQAGFNVATPAAAPFLATTLPRFQFDEAPGSGPALGAFGFDGSPPPLYRSLESAVAASSDSWAAPAAAPPLTAPSSNQRMSFFGCAPEPQAAALAPPLTIHGTFGVARDAGAAAGSGGPAAGHGFTRGPLAPGGPSPARGPPRPARQAVLVKKQKAIINSEVDESDVRMGASENQQLIWESKAATIKHGEHVAVSAQSCDTEFDMNRGGKRCVIGVSVSLGLMLAGLGPVDPERVELVLSAARHGFTNTLDTVPFVSDECCICLDKDPDTIFYPCRHQATHYNCVKDLGADKKCPICRSAIRACVQPANPIVPHPRPERRAKQTVPMAVLDRERKLWTKMHQALRTQSQTQVNKFAAQVAELAKTNDADRQKMNSALQASRRALQTLDAEINNQLRGVGIGSAYSDVGLGVGAIAAGRNPFEFNFHCPKLHKMQLTTSAPHNYPQEAGYNCDVCKSLGIRFDSPFMHCPLCTYDICPKCIQASFL
jgi:Zinc finger, C3HC4 type (RING finger)